jgi:hypothetical protein
VKNKKQNHPPLAHKMKEYNSAARADDDAMIIMITQPIYLRCIVLTGGDVNYALTAGVLLAERFQNKPASRSLARPLLRAMYICMYINGEKANGIMTHACMQIQREAVITLAVSNFHPDMQTPRSGYCECGRRLRE